jgi:hypothetical protein
MGRTLLVSLLVAGIVAGIAGPSSATDADRARRAVAYIGQQQLPDGSIPAFSAIGSTADALLAMVSANTGGAKAGQALAYLRTATQDGDVDSTGLRAKVALAVGAYARDATAFGGHDLIGEITAIQRANGRFGSASVFDQALAVLAINAATGGWNLDAIGWLDRAQCPDGGWQYDAPWTKAEGPHCRNLADPANDFFTSDSNTTAYVIMAILPSGKVTPDADPFAFLSSLRDRRHDGWGYTWGYRRTDANSTALVIQAYRAAGVALPDGSMRALRKLQYPCGAFAYSYDDAGMRTGRDIGATIGAVLGLLRQPLPVPADGSLAPMPTSSCPV